MKSEIETLRDLDILEQIETNPESTQATIAEQLGVAVGTVNWHLKRLVEKGCIKIQRCERRKLKYIITPEGVTLRGRLMLNYIHSSMELYRLIRERMNHVLDSCANFPERSMNIDGEGEIAEICRLTCMERGWEAVSGAGSDIPRLEIDGLKLFLTLPETETAYQTE